MRILSISADRKLFEADSAVLARHKKYAQMLGNLDIIVTTTKEHDVRELSYPDVGLRIFPSNAKNRYHYPQSAYKKAEKLVVAGSYDAVTTQDPFFETGLVGYWLKKSYKLRWYPQLRTDFLAKSFRAESIFHRIRYYIAKVILRRADKLRVVSNRIKESIVAKKLLKEEKICVLPTYSDHPQPEPKRVQELKERYQQYDTILLTAARLSPEKNIGMQVQLLSDCIKEFPKTGLIIIGEGPEEKVLKEIAQKSQAEKNIHFLPWQSSQELANYYALADIYLLTSNYEGYGKVLIEAALNQCAILTSDVGAAKELVGEQYESLLFKPHDKNAAQKNLEQLLKNPQLRNQYISALSEHAKEINYRNDENVYREKLREFYSA